MNTKQYLDRVAYVKELDQSNGSGDPDFINDCYFSKFDDSYITHVGVEDGVKHLAKLEITDELTHGVGFSPKDNKWYGWSHRAIYGFKVGSTCEKGNCHYVASTPEELIDDHANFFLDISQESADEKRAECQILDDRSGIRILHTPIKLQMAENTQEVIKAIAGAELPEETLFKDSFSVIECGRGAWTAKTMADAKQMAQDFNSGVS